MSIVKATAFGPATPSRLLGVAHRYGRMMRWVRMVYVVGFAEGTLAHLYDLGTGGITVYSAYPVVIGVFFHLLVLLDPAVVVLVWRRRPVGAVLAAAVMVGDLVTNWMVSWSAVTADPGLLLRPVGLPSITAFGLFVLVTCVPFYRSMRPSADERSPVGST